MSNPNPSQSGKGKHKENGGSVSGLSGLEKFGMLADKLQKAGRRTTGPPLATFPFNQS